MYGGGPGSMRGRDAGGPVRVCAASTVPMSGTTAHATTALRVWTGSIFAPATTSCGRAASVRQQSFALPCAAHESSPSLQHAICALIVVIAASAHAAYNDQVKAVATVNARRRAAARRNVIDAIVPPPRLMTYCPGSRLRAAAHLTGGRSNERWRCSTRPWRGCRQL